MKAANFGNSQGNREHGIIFQDYDTLVHSVHTIPI
jgi:hypothetical protein